MRTFYKFKKGDLIKIPSIKGYLPNEGEVLKQRFSLFSLKHKSLIPQKYTTVMLQRVYDFGEGPKKVNLLRLEFPEKELQKLEKGLTKIII